MTPSSFKISRYATELQYLYFIQQKTTNIKRKCYTHEHKHIPLIEGSLKES